MTGFSLVAAMDAQRGIGFKGDLPWHLPADMAYFKKLTTETRAPDKTNAVIMGRKTWESIPDRFRPLPNRHNVILTRQPDYDPGKGARVAGDLDQALSLIAAIESIDVIFVIGGGAVYDEAIRRKDCNRVFLTEIETRFRCDTFFPELPAEFSLASCSSEQEQKGLKFRFAEYQRI